MINNLRKTVTGLWIGNRLPPLAVLCIKSYQENGYGFRLLTYEKIDNLPQDTFIVDANTILDKSELFVHRSGSLAPTADRIRYKYLSNHGGIWTDMDVVCLKEFEECGFPLFGLQEQGLANLAVLNFPRDHEVMKYLEIQMKDPASVMPWDAPNEIRAKRDWIKNVPERKERQMQAEWSLGGPEGFTRALKYFGIFHLAVPEFVFNPVPYTSWRWSFDGTLLLGDKCFANSFGIHLWAELLRREPDALDNIALDSVVSVLMHKYRCYDSPQLKWPKQVPELIKRKKFEVLVAVCSCQKHTDKREAIRKTWMSNEIAGVKTLFFVGGQISSTHGDTITLETPDDYSHLPQKIRSFFVYALDNYDFDWIFKCDDDTYVALDRLSDLIDPDYEIIGSEYLEQRGSPSGGAGYFLSRNIVKLLVSDPELPLIGDEDIIHGEAAIRYGAAPKSTRRLRMNAVETPRADNDLVTAHWCSPEKLKEIDGLLTKSGKFEVQITHPYWSDKVILYENGYFKRLSTKCGGKWSDIEGETLQLEWFDWPPESYVKSKRDPFVHDNKALIAYELINADS